MAELQRNFLQGIMNKDLDPHFLPDGQYRDALNIIVSDSDATFSTVDGQHNGSVQNYLGNTLMNSSLGLTNARCIGSLAYDASNLIYWLVAADNADAIFEYNEALGLTTVVLKATKNTPTTPSILNFNKAFYVTGINYINGLLFWTDNYNPPRRINVERAKNYGVNNFTEDDISVILAPPLSAPSIALSNDGSSNNLEDKFLYFAYRYKYIDNEYSALSPFSPVAFLPKKYEYDYGVSENVSMTNSFNTVTLTYNRGGSNVKEVQLVFRDTRSLNAYVIDNIQTDTLSSSLSQTYQFKNNKVYSILDADQVNRLFDNVPLKAKSQELIGSRLIYGNYTQFFDLVNCLGSPISPKFSLSLTTQSITGLNPKPTFKSNRDYEIGLVYLDDYGRSTTVVVPEGDNTVNTNTIFIPATNSDVANNIRVTINKDFEPPCFATYYRFYIKQNRQEYYNVFPLTYFTEGEFRWFLINQADADKISVGSYVYIKNPPDSSFDVKYKILDIQSKSAGFLNTTTQTQPAGIYFKIKVSNAALPPIEQYFFNSRGASGAGTYQTITNRFSVAEKAIFYGKGVNDLATGNNNIYTTSTSGDGLDARFYVEISDDTSSPNKYNWYIWQRGQPKALVASNVSIVAGTDVALTYTYPSPSYSLSCSIRFSSAVGHTKNDYWVINCRCAQGLNIFGGTNYAPAGDWPSVLVTGIGWNPTPTYNADRPISIGDTLSFNLVEPDTLFNQTLTFISNGNYVNIEEWFIEDNAYLKWTQNDGGGDRGPAAVSFRRANNISEFTTGIYQASQGTTNTATTRNYPILMYVLGYRQDNSSVIYSNFTYTHVVGGGSLLFETAPEDSNQDIYYELTGTYPITNGNHYGNVQSQVVGTQPAIVDLNTFGVNSNFNAFAWGNKVESYRIRDDFNAATMEFSPRANSTIEGYEQQTLVQALTYSGVYQQTTALNRLNEFNLSLANFKYLDRFFGNIEKLYSRDTDLVVFQENKVSKVLYGKNLLSDSVGGGTIASIPEVLGTQIAYVGEYGISNNPESFAIWGNNLYFTDARRGAVLQLTEAGIFEISSNGMKNWFKANLDPDTQKLGMFDPYFEHYVLANNEIQIGYCVFDVSEDAVNFASNAINDQYAFRIQSNSEWYITVPTNNWLTINTLYGSGNALIYFDALVNNGAQRSVTITVKGCSGNHNVVFTQATSVPTTTVAPTTTLAPTTLAPTTTLLPTTLAPTTTLQPVWYRTTACTNGDTVYTTQRTIGTFAINDRLTFGGAFFVVQEEVNILPGGPLIAMTGTGLTGCPATTTTIPPTTTLPPVTFTYSVSCEGGPGTGVITITSISGGTGTGYQYSLQPTPGIWYDYPATNQLTGLDNNTYNVAVRDSLGNGSSITGIVVNCGVPTTIAPTTTIPPTTTLQPVWYRTTSCLDGSTVYTTQRTIGSFAINDRLTFGGVFFVVQEELYSNPGGSLVDMVGTGFVGCPATTTAPTTPAPTTTLPPVSFTYATSCAGGEGSGVITITGISGGSGTGYQYSIQPTPGIWYDYPAGNQLTGLSNGTYTVAVRDILGNGTSTPGISISCITPTTTIAPTTTTIPPVTCSTYQFTDDIGNGGIVYYVPCGSSTETSIYINPLSTQQVCVMDNTYPFSPDGIIIDGPITACV